MTYVLKITFQVIGGLQPNWTSYLHKTLLGLVAQLITSLALELKIW
jgi:hypothetical protein